MDELGAVQKHEFETLYVSGFDAPTNYKMLPPEVYELLDGTTKTEYRVFKKIISVSLEPIETGDEFLLAFFKAPVRSMEYQGHNIVSEEEQVAWEEIDVESYWIDDFKLQKQFDFKLIGTARSSWIDPVPHKDNMTGFIIHDVEVIGTLDSPEEFETNVGKLQFQHDAVVFPPISLLSNKVTILFDYDQAWMFQRVGAITQSGNNIKFHLAMSGSGEYATGASTVKATFVILLQDITV